MFNLATHFLSFLVRSNFVVSLYIGLKLFKTFRLTERNLDLFVIDFAEEVFMRLVNLNVRGRRLTNTAEVYAVETLQERVALHNLVVKVRQCGWRGLVHNEREPKAQARDVYRTPLNIHTIDVLLNDVAFDVGGIVEVLDGTRHIKSSLSKPIGNAPEPMAGSQIFTSFSF